MKFFKIQGDYAGKTIQCIDIIYQLPLIDISTRNENTVNLISLPQMFQNTPPAS